MNRNRSWILPYRVTVLPAGVLALSLWSGCVGAPEPGSTGGEGAIGSTFQALKGGPEQLREAIDRQVGGLDKLKVPASDALIPVQSDPNRPGRYETTEAKRYLGKMLFHDPVRTARINVNTKVPFDLPKGTAFGGTVKDSEPNLKQIVDATIQSGSCGSCHLGEASGKAGAVLNFNVGGEGRGYTDEKGNYIIRRRPQAILTKVRANKLFDGDLLVDALPTLTDFYSINGKIEVAIPSRAIKAPMPDGIVATGRLDQLDSVGRQSPSMIGFAFNNRLLLGGFAGEAFDSVGGLNPFKDPAQENLTLLLLDAHRMLDFESDALLGIKAFVKLFEDAFPAEAASAKAQGNPRLLVNDDTVLRATATFLRTTVTRNTPFDHFLAGDNRALTERQQRGARLFFTRAQDGGAGCFTCHSGPMLNKQYNDPDVAGVGHFVEENFINVGIGDHPLQALNRLARNLPDPADAQHKNSIDTGRQEITKNPDHAFKFRSLTLRQLKDARTFFHNGSFTSVRDVVSYFNKGVPQDDKAANAGTLDPRFTQPRGGNAPRGLGLDKDDIDALTDFLEEGLYDPAFVTYDPRSTTRMFQPTPDDLHYSKNRPDLAALGARDGMLLSGKAIDNDDPLSRRDQGLEFLDVTGQLRADRTEREEEERWVEDEFRFTNSSQSIVDTHLLVIVRGLPANIRLDNASGTTKKGEPYLRVFLPGGVLNPGQSIRRELEFARPPRTKMPAYTLTFLSGQGAP